MEQASTVVQNGIRESKSDDPIAIDPNFRIELPNFEGPLDLLLHLIRKHELDVLDLPVAFVTEEYLKYIGLMEQLNLDVASEYLVMAATLAHIKSKTLLPKPPVDQDDDGQEEDPRAELIRRLLEYQKYKRVAEDLGSRGLAGRDVFYRGTPKPKAEGKQPLAPTNVFKLLDAFQKIAERTKADLSLEISADGVTIHERMSQIIDELRQKRQCSFDELFAGAASTYDLVVTFLALLEMANSRLMRIHQAGTEEPMYLEYTLIDDDGTLLEPTTDFDIYSDADDAPRESIIVPAGTTAQATAYSDELYKETDQ